MGRQVRRVRLDFNWPINRIWGGFINPFYSMSTKCPDCGGSGSSPQIKQLTERWYGDAPFKPEDRGSIPWKPTDKPIRQFATRNIARGLSLFPRAEKFIELEAERLCRLFNRQWCHHLNQDDVNALVAAGRLLDFTHTWTKEKGWQPKVPPYIPTAAEVNVSSLQGLGHDSINQWVCVDAEAKRLGYDKHCKRCKGEGNFWPTRLIKFLADHWRPTNPPKGQGWQLWETVSEGSPISPVFKTPHELARWLVESPDYSWRRLDAGTTYEQWMAFILGTGFALSFVSKGAEIKSGVQFAADQQLKKN